MSSSQQYQYSSYSSTSSTTENGVHRTGSAYQQTSQADPSGSRIQTTSQNLGEQPVQQTRYYDAEGNKVLGTGGQIGGAQAATQGRIEEIGDADDQEAEK